MGVIRSGGKPDEAMSRSSTKRVVDGLKYLQKHAGTAFLDSLLVHDNAVTGPVLRLVDQKQGFEALFMRAAAHIRDSLNTLTLNAPRDEVLKPRSEVHISKRV